MQVTFESAVGAGAGIANLAEPFPHPAAVACLAMIEVDIGAFVLGGGFGEHLAGVSSTVSAFESADADAVENAGFGDRAAREGNGVRAFGNALDRSHAGIFPASVCRLPRYNERYKIIPGHSDRRRCRHDSAEESQTPHPRACQTRPQAEA